MSAAAAPVSASAATRSLRFHALDVWRGVVCLLVVLEHAGVALWAGAGEGTGLDGWVRRAFVWCLELNLGTPLFFVMSGFCIASTVESARRRGTSPFVFLARRLWRIFPSYWAALLMFVAVVAGLDLVGLRAFHQNSASLALESPAALNAWQWFGNISLTETWRPMLGGSAETSVYTRVAWSLCYQEQFYIVCFLTLLFFPARYYRVLAGVTAAVVALRVAAWDSGGLNRIEGMFPNLWHEFAVGMLVYWRLSLPTTFAVRRGIELGLAGLLGIALWSGLVSTAGASAFGLMLVALFRWDEKLPAQRWLDPVRACGRRSYSLYLTHLPVVMLVNSGLQEMGVERFWTRMLVMVPAATVASLVFCWGFHAVIERHFLELPRVPSPRAAARRVRLVLAGVSRSVRTGGFVAVPAAGPGRAGRFLALVLVPLGLAAGAACLRSEPSSRPTPRLEIWLGQPRGWVRQHERQVARSVARGAEVVFLGDSITYNWGDETRDDHGALAWRELVAPLRPANLGAIGDRTEHLLWRIQHGALSCRPRVAVVLIGTNNLTAGRSPEETSRGIATVVATIREQSPRTRVLLLGLLPRHASLNDPMRQQVDRVNALIARLDDGDSVQVLDVGAQLLRTDGRIRPDTMPDFLHPCAEGYRICAEALHEPLRDMLDRAGPVGRSIARVRPARRSAAPRA